MDTGKGEFVLLRIENPARATTLIDRGRIADNAWRRLRGLIGVRELTDGDGLLIEPCKGVHCMFMSIPIDVVYVSKENEVVAVDEAMKPWRIGRLYRRSHRVLELPAGTVAQTRTQVGDRLEIHRP